MAFTPFYSYLEEVLFEAGLPQSSSGQPQVQPSIIASNSVGASSLPPSPPILHTIGVEQFLQDFAHELPPLDMNPAL